MKSVEDKLQKSMMIFYSFSAWFANQFYFKVQRIYQMVIWTANSQIKFVNRLVMA